MCYVHLGLTCSLLVGAHTAASQLGTVAKAVSKLNLASMTVGCSSVVEACMSFPLVCTFPSMCLSPQVSTGPADGNLLKGFGGAAGDPGKLLPKAQGSGTAGECALALLTCTCAYLCMSVGMSVGSQDP